VKVRKKPIVVEAIQFTGMHSIEHMDREWGAPFQAISSSQAHTNCLWLRTLEGTMSVPFNNWVIRGVNGEFYSCAPDIFDKTYDIVE
jgi:hypothetical protein